MEDGDECMKGVGHSHLHSKSKYSPAPAVRRREFSTGLGLQPVNGIRQAATPACRMPAPWQPLPSLHLSTSRCWLEKGGKLIAPADTANGFAGIAGKDAGKANPSCDFPVENF